MKKEVKKVVDNKKQNDFNGLKINNIFSFYIDDINDKFFTSLKNHPNRYFVNKVLPKIKKNFDEDELEKFTEIDSLTKNNKIKLMLNLALKKIASKTGTDDCELFAFNEKDQFGDYLFINQITPRDEAKILGDANIDRKYQFGIDINSKSYLYKYISQIQLSFFLEDESKMLSGGFSLNKSFVENVGISFTNTISQIYFYSLIKHFISKQLYPISLNNMLDMFESFEYNRKKRKVSTKTKYNIDFKQVTIESLKENWVSLVNRKYLNFLNIDKEQRQYYEDTLFYSILIVTVIMLALYEELKKYFTHQKPELILSLLDKHEMINSNTNQDPETDFYEIAKFLNTNYVDKNKSIKLNKIKNFEDVIETLSEQKSYDLNSFGKPIISIELYRKENKPFIDEQQLLIEDSRLRTIYLATISPELFGMDESTGYFIEYKQFHDIVHKNTLQKFKMSESLGEKIDKSRCELNYDYITFISNEPSMLIIKNNTESINQELFSPVYYSGLYEDYFWSQIYVQARIWKKIHIESEFNYDVLNKIDIYHKDKLTALENLLFNWYDNFYGMPEIKNIVYKINQLSDIKNSIEMLFTEIRQRDELSKKDKERKSVLFAYVIATLIGFINFFGMIFTVLTVPRPEDGLHPANIIVIGIGTILVSVLVGILIFFGTKVLRSKFSKPKQ